MKKFIYIFGLFLFAACSEATNELPGEEVKEETAPENKDNTRSDIALTGEQKELIESQTEFAVKFFNASCKTSDEKNVIVSPLSVAQLLSMAANGAADALKEEIVGAMMPEKEHSLNKLNSFNKYLTDNLLKVDKEVKTGFPNSLWYVNDKKNIAVNQSFEDKCSEFYNITIKQTSQSALKGELDDWARKATDGFFKEFPHAINGAEVILNNITYFNGGWEIDFDKKNTETRSFTNISGKEVKVDMIREKNTTVFLPEKEEASSTVGAIRYGNGAYSFVFMMPNSGFNTFVDGLTKEYILAKIEGLKESPAGIGIPKFELEYKNDLLKSLPHAGITKLAGSNMFPNIISGSGIFINNAEQSVKFKVDETGAEGAASSNLSWVSAPEPGSVTSGPKQIILDRPFVFMIVEQSTKAILFMGKVTEL